MANDPRQNLKKKAGSSAATVNELRERVIARLSGTLTAPRQLVDLKLPPALAEQFNAIAISRLQPAAVLVPLLERPAGLHVLLTQRSEHLRTHAGQISFPGGRCDASDADIIHTALRETEEEVGLPSHYVQAIGFLDDYPTITGYRVTPVVGLVSGDPPITADGTEVSAVLEVPLDFLLDASNYQSRSFIRDNYEVPYYEIQFHSTRIWGATAGMLKNFCDKLQRSPS